MFKRLSNRRKLACCLVAGVVLHGATIETANFYRKREPEFRLGSADELLTDNLRAGDVVMFSRTWYKYHLPVAIMIKLQHAIFDCEFDHSGVIVMQLGVPYILERTPFRGTICRPFEERVRNSQSAHIIVLPLDKNNALSMQQTQNLRKYATTLSASEGSLTKGELFGNTRGLVTYMAGNVFQASSMSRYYCPNVELLMNAWGSMNLECRPSQHTKHKHMLTLKDIHERQVIISSGSSQMKLSENDVLIRSS